MALSAALLYLLAVCRALFFTFAMSSCFPLSFQLFSHCFLFSLLIFFSFFYLLPIDWFAGLHIRYNMCVFGPRAH